MRGRVEQLGHGRRELAATVLTQQGVSEIEHAVDRSEEWQSVAELTALLRCHGRS